MARAKTAEQMYTLREVASLMRWSLATTYRRIHAGELRVANAGVKGSPKMRVSESALAEYQNRAA